MSVQETVLVGTDGSEPALTAVRWAALEAQRRGTTLTVLHAYDEDWSAMPGLPWPHPPGDPRDHAEAVVATAREAATGAAPAITVHTVVVPGDPAATLVGHATTAGLTVVGHRGRGGFTSLMLGSVGQRVATRARCSAVVVRGRTVAFTDPVAVGADGSPAARVAMAAAFGVAHVRGAALLAVHAYREPLPSGLTGREIAAADMLDRLLDPLRKEFPDVPVGTLVHAGPAARLLVGVSHQAQLIVAGAHEAGGLPGPITWQLLHHADCPVLVAR
ncbi:universal stress protein [Actinoplanes lobatus]|uniref:Nucleotide-binding universal stress UspA family protein n=1 Tax=Actinoplanes lobatus TaxID=113568 RepID=A0A7W7HNC6_9ACTN|nr:universal stress protein [Actinoplanes lobatus]MBB4753599.1 nucleotide-binding universal stress UspA family protein [Actinoplanes lobatus]GGN84590.1 universal stress protein [Actinoplanes lobatus]GIE38136.1 universal stress protein [Actinoplanes lobatus]